MIHSNPNRNYHVLHPRNPPLFHFKNLFKHRVFVVWFLVAFLLVGSIVWSDIEDTSRKSRTVRLQHQSTSIDYYNAFPIYSDNNNNNHRRGQNRPLKILYMVTSLAEYDTGKRQTTRGFDRFQETLIPVVREGIESMLSYGYLVDLYLICHYTLTEDRYQLLRNAISSPLVGIQVWNDATPLGYKLEETNRKWINRTQPITRALARQHRFVIKDKLIYYDVFANFEDDMLIKGDSIQHYVNMTLELQKLEHEAPEREDPSTKKDRFYGIMTKAMLQRTMPGYIRVEALLDEAKFGTQQQLGPIPLTDRPNIDPRPCCHISNQTVADTRPPAPSSDELFLWETDPLALGVRKLPISSSSSSSSTSLDWVVLQRGPYFERGEENLTIPDYWSGRDGYYGKSVSRPHPQLFPYVNNQGGWMATQEQIWNWHTKICAGSLLPPYDEPYFGLDGLDMRNVEYWSGGIQLVTRRNGCRLQRLISLNPARLARQLLYHTSNNKQRQLKGKRERMIKINDFVGQLNTVRHNAVMEMQRRLDSITKKWLQQNR